MTKLKVNQIDLMESLPYEQAEETPADEIDVVGEEIVETPAETITEDTKEISEKPLTENKAIDPAKEL